jgi:hypothetical protein
VSIFSLSRFDPDAELRALQKLWFKRDLGSSYLILSPEPREIKDAQISGATTEHSFFECDSDEDEAERDSKRLSDLSLLIQGNDGVYLVEELAVHSLLAEADGVISSTDIQLEDSSIILVHISRKDCQTATILDPRYSARLPPILLAASRRSASVTFSFFSFSLTT